MNWEQSESFGEDLEEDEPMDLRQTTSSALTRVAKRVGAWSQDDRSLGFVDVSGNPTLPAQWTTPILLNGLVPGTGASQRVGREVHFYTILLRIDGGTTSKCRYVLVVDHQANAATPAVTDVFQTDAYLSEPNYSYRDRFEIIFDLVLPEISTNHHEACIEHSLLTFYNAGTAGTVADIASGALYLMMNESSTSASTAPSYNVRLLYEE